MKTEPISAARIRFAQDGATPPMAPDFADLYHPQVGAPAQARHVFLHGNGLPARWAGRSDFVVLETGFGLGNNFLATWDAWRSDPARSERLHYVAVERHPPNHADLARAHATSPWPELATQLLQQWPALTANLHRLAFESGRVVVLLAWGDAAALLPQLRLQADAVYLDGFAPARNPQMWQPRLLKSLGRLAAPDATAATWSVAREVGQGLRTAGFELQRAPGIGGKREITLARFRPRFVPRRQPPAVPAAMAAGLHHGAVVVGAGLAGAAVARALAELGLAVTVLEQQPRPAMGASGNAGGLFHGTVHADDGPHARLFRAAALLAQKEHASMIASGVAGSAAGLLRLAPAGATVGELRDLLQAQGLPPDFVRALDPTEAHEQAGVALPGPAWFYPGGGWVAPAPWVQQALRTPGVQLRCGAAVAALRRDGSDWCLLAADGSLLARSPRVVLAAAQHTAPLLAATLGPVADWPLQLSRGQISQCPMAPGAAPTLRLPVAGDGYALPLPDGSWLFGATRQPGDTDPTLREADQRHNLQRLQRLTGVVPPEVGSCSGRVGWRLQSADGLPIAGALPLGPWPQDGVPPPLRRLPREPGLFVCTALGARGLTLAPLLARLVAAQATGTPWPVEQDLADAVDPARWLVRRWRRAAASPVAQGRADSQDQPGGPA